MSLHRDGPFVIYIALTAFDRTIYVREAYFDCHIG